MNGILWNVFGDIIVLSCYLILSIYNFIIFMIHYNFTQRNKYFLLKGTFNNDVTSVLEWKSFTQQYERYYRDVFEDCITVLLTVCNSYSCAKLHKVNFFSTRCKFILTRRSWLVLKNLVYATWYKNYYCRMLLRIAMWLWCARNIFLFHFSNSDFTKCFFLFKSFY